MFSFICYRLTIIDWLVGWLVGWGSTSHSAIFQLYSNRTVVKFHNLDLLPGTQSHGQLGVSSVPSLYPDTGTGTSEDVFNLLAIKGPTRGDRMPGIEPGSPDLQSTPLPLCHNGGWTHYKAHSVVKTGKTKSMVRNLSTCLTLFV